MKIAVAGLWHLGSVVAACLAQAGFDVIGIDDAAIVAGLAAGHAPLFEPGLDALLAAGIAAGRLRFSAEASGVLHGADLLWVTYDTPVDDDDRADIEFVVARAAAFLPMLRDGATVLLSSQLLVGTTRRLRDLFSREYPGRQLCFAYCPENLRLGKAISAFVAAERIVVGCDSAAARANLAPLFERLGNPVIWMGLESAEMVKHTINAFLAVSVAFINEIAVICEQVGADAGDVESGIRSEPRIGRRAYVTPGGAFGGGTLARDVGFLAELAASRGLAAPLIGQILPSNRLHGGWAFRRICEILGQGGAASLQGLRVAVLGLSYKPNTSSLRRSTAVELCQLLHSAGARVHAYDPAVPELPVAFAGAIGVAPTAAAAISGADALVIATEWPEFAALDPAGVAVAMRRPVVLDPGGFLAGRFGAQPGMEYFRVGQPG
jgi:UDPglucose 6-dehydrogenase